MILNKYTVLFLGEVCLKFIWIVPAKFLAHTDWLINISISFSHIWCSLNFRHMYEWFCAFLHATLYSTCCCYASFFYNDKINFNWTSVKTLESWHTAHMIHFNTELIYSQKLVVSELLRYDWIINKRKLCLQKMVWFNFRSEEKNLDNSELWNAVRTLLLSLLNIRLTCLIWQ